MMGWKASSTLSRSDLGDHVWRFEIKDNDTHEHSMHPHFMCNACGRVSCLENIAITPSVQADQNIGEVSEILFKGRCRTCAQA